MKSRVVAIAVCVLFMGAAPAFAQSTSTPSPAPITAPTIPPNIGGVVQQIIQKITGDATAGYGVDPNHVRGTVTYFRRFDLQIQMPLNTYKQIHLHQGTIINPRGTTLAPGQVVDVRGRANADGSLEADEITLIHN